jgi:hypothetical protein
MAPGRPTGMITINSYDYDVVAGLRVDLGGRSYRYCD